MWFGHGQDRDWRENYGDGYGWSRLRGEGMSRKRGERSDGN